MESPISRTRGRSLALESGIQTSSHSMDSRTTRWSWAREREVKARAIARTEITVLLSIKAVPNYRILRPLGRPHANSVVGNHGKAAGPVSTRFDCRQGALVVG